MRRQKPRIEYGAGSAAAMYHSAVIASDQRKRGKPVEFIFSPRPSRPRGNVPYSAGNS